MTLSRLLSWLEEGSGGHLQWGRIHSNLDLLLAVAVFVALCVYVWAMYRRDARELGRGWGWLLAGLRSLVFLALLLFYFQPQWRREREEVQNSRVVVLVDTSQSMKLVDRDVSPSTRASQVAEAMAKTSFVERLREAHDVVVMRFDDALRPVASLEKAEKGEPAAESEKPKAESGTANAPLSNFRFPVFSDWEKALEPAGRETRLGEALAQVIAQQRGFPLSGIVVISDGGQNAGRSPESVLEAAAEAKIPLFPVGVGSVTPPANVRVAELEVPERVHPGDPYTVVGQILAVGLAGRPITVEVVARDPQKGTDQAVPNRTEVLPEDGKPLVVKVQLTPGEGEKGRRQIVFRVVPPPEDRNPDDNQRTAETEIVDRKTHVLLFAGAASREYQFVRGLLHRDKKTTILDVLLQTGAAGVSQEAVTILKDLPATPEAMSQYDCVIAFDPRWQAPTDKLPGVTDRQVELLEKWIGQQGGGLIVIAGPVHAGQMVDGWVQDPARSMVRTLYPVEFQRFGSVMESGYGSREPCPLLFTREYREAPFLWLDESDEANQLAWRRFFAGSDDAGQGGRAGGGTAGLSSSAASGGMYGCLPVRSPKPGAKVYARLRVESSESGRLGRSESQPQLGDTREAGAAPQSTSEASTLDSPIFMAGQFYGCGRVFYIGSGEMWRLRSVSEACFDRFYTRLIRNVAQERLLRQSNRGSLTVDKEQYLLGSTVELRAQLNNAQAQPLQAAKVPVQAVRPDGTLQALTLVADADRPGVFGGQFTVLQEGQYRLQLSLPESTEPPISRRVQVVMPNLEQETLQRNEPLLRQLADGFKDVHGRKLCEGKYYSSLAAALGPASDDPLIAHLHGEPRTLVIEEGPDLMWEQAWLGWMMGVVCGLLCVEWLIRRLWRLA